MLAYVSYVLVALATAVLIGKTGSWKRIAGLSLVLYAFLAIAPLWTMWAFYREILESFEGAGWLANPYLQKSLAVLVAMVFAGVLPTLLGYTIRLNKWAPLLIVGSALFGGDILLYLITQPRPGQASNPKTGSYLYKYYFDKEKGCVDRFPREFEFNPYHVNVKLEPPTDALAQEWNKNPCNREENSEELKKLREQSEKLKNAGQTDAPSPLYSTRHENLLDNVLFKFDSCKEQSGAIFCAISVINKNTTDRYVTFLKDVSAVDEWGNTHFPVIDVGGLWSVEHHWFSGDTYQDSYELPFTSYTPIVVHLNFTDIPSSVGLIRNIRLKVGISQEETSDHQQPTDFTNLPITRAAVVLPAQGPDSKEKNQDTVKEIQPAEADTAPAKQALKPTSSEPDILFVPDPRVLRDDDLGIELNLLTCANLNNRLACVFTVNNQTAGDLGFRIFTYGASNQGAASSVIDEYGTECFADNSELGKSLQINWSWAGRSASDLIRVPASSTISAKLLFNNCPTQAHTLQTLSVFYQAPRFGHSDLHGPRKKDFHSIKIDRP